MTDYEQTMARYVDMIESSLPEYLPGMDCPQKDVVEAMTYSLTGGGKRIRGVLLLAWYQLLGADVQPEEALPFAAALEMIHAYSLIHDDLPCMDNDDMRRGKPSCHIAFGEAIALLAGDGLLTLAFETVSSRQCIDRYGGEKIAIIVQKMAVASGSMGMIGGQVMDLQHEGEQIFPELLRQTDTLKTGALFRLSVEIGCILAGATQQQTQHALQFADHLGLCFQVVDDILDCTADEHALGKPVNSDIEQSKSTYTSIYGIEKARQMAMELSRLASMELKELNLSVFFLQELIDRLCVRSY